MFKRFGRLSLGALLAALLISHNPVAKAEMSARETIQMIELKGNIRAQITKEFVLKGFLASTTVGLNWANHALRSQKRLPLFCLPTDKSPTADENYKLLKDFVRLNPEANNEPVGSILLVAYMFIYPCR